MSSAISMIVISRQGVFTALVIFVVLVLGSAVLYRRQTKQMRWRWRLVVVLARLLAVSALSLSLLQPMVVRKAHASEQGAVVIIVDHSHSMSHKDYEDHPDQAVALADGLDLLPPNLRSRGDEWIAMVAQLNAAASDLSDAQSELVFARVSGRNTTEAAAQLAAATVRFDSAAQALLARRGSLSANSSLAFAIDGFKAALRLPRNLSEAGDVSDSGEDWLSVVKSRLNAVAEAAARFQLESDQALYRTNAQVKQICDALEKRDRLGVVELAMTKQRSGLLWKLSREVGAYGFAAGDRLTPLPLRGSPHGQGEPVRRLLLDTDEIGMNLTRAVREAVARLGGVSIRTIVLFSAGRQPVTDAAELRDTAIGTPVLAVCAALKSGSAHGPAEQVAIGPLQFPAKVFVGEEFTVAARVRGIGFGAKARQELTCHADGALNAKVAQSVELSRGGNEVSFAMRIDQPGAHRITVSWPGFGSVERWIEVVAKPMRVAVEAQSPKWDWRMARRDLSGNAAFTIRADVFADGAVSLTPQQILQQDALVLFDPQRQSLDERQERALDEMVRKRGGLLVIVGAVSGGPDSITASSIMRDLLPVEISPAMTRAAVKEGESAGAGWVRWLGTQAPYRMSPPGTSAAKIAWSSISDWKSLPPLFRYARAGPRPISNPLLEVSQTGEVVAAEMPEGFGHVVWIGLDEIWRWNAAHPDAGDWFWGPLLRHFMAKPFSVTDGRLSLDIGGASVVSGQSFEVRAEFTDAMGLPEDVPITMEVLQGGKNVRALSPRHDGVGEWSDRFSSLPVGAYEVQASVSGKEASTAADLVDGRHVVQQSLHVLHEYDAEFQNAAPDRAELARIADASHGRMLEMEQVRQLPEMLEQAAVTSTVSVPLWDSFYLFGFAVACFCGEWAVRKRLGLA